MPKEWFDRHANTITEGMSDEERRRREFNLRILADKKPYFMRYIYPELIGQYNEYMLNSNKKCIRRFRNTIDDIKSKRDEDISEEEREFIDYYECRMPVGMHECVMNKICLKFEKEFDSYFLKNIPEEKFNYEIMKSDQYYSSKQYYAIARLYEQYTKRVNEYMQYSKKERVDEDEIVSKRGIMLQEFKSECYKVCSSGAQLCDIVLDLCYSQNSSKQFCWDMCGEEIVENLLNKNNRAITYPTQDVNGEVRYNGKCFAFVRKEINSND